MGSEPFWPEFAILLSIGCVTSLVRFLFLGLLGDIPNLYNEWEEGLDEFTSHFTAAVTLDVFPNLLMEGLMLVIAVALGLLCAHSIHLGAPLLNALLTGKQIGLQFQHTMIPGIGSGLAIGGIIFLMEKVFFRKRLRKIVHYAPTRWRRWKFVAASFHLGIALEIFLRLFLLSLLAWVASRIWHTPTGEALPAVLWISNVAISLLAAFVGRQAVLFNSALTGMFSPLIITRTVLLDGLVGIAFGYLFWQYGLEAAIAAHVVAGVFLQLAGGRPPLAWAMPEELMKLFQDHYKKRSGVQIISLGDAPHFEFPPSTR